MADNRNNSNVGRSIYLDTTSATTALKKLTDQQEILTRAIQNGEKAGKDMSNEIAQMADIKAKIKPVQDAIDRGLAPSLREMEKTVKGLRNELRGMSTDAPGFAQKLKAYNSASKDLDNLRGKLGQVNDANNKLGGSFLSMTKNLAGIAVATLGVQSLIGFFQNSVDEAMQAEQALSRFHNTLENIGRLDAFDRLLAKADEVAAKFKYLDNDDVTGVFQKLIQYGKLTERQINDLLPVIIDFSAKNKVSLEESTSVIVKALEGSGKALKEYGIDIKDGADLTERLGIIMGQLAPRVDGAAEAFGNTFAGQLAIARQEIKDTQEEIGNDLVPVLNTLLKVASQAIKGLISMGKVLKDTFSGDFLTAFTKNNAENIKKGDEKAEQMAVDGIISAYKKDSQGKTRAAKEIYALINADLNNDLNQLAIKKAFNDIDGQITYERSIEVTKKALAKVQAELNPELDKVLGQGGSDKAGGDDAAKMEALRGRFEDLIAKLNETAALLNLSPMEAQFLKINDLLKKQIADINELQSKGAITAKEAADAIKLAQQAAQLSSEDAFQKELAARAKQRGDTRLIGTTTFTADQAAARAKGNGVPTTFKGKDSGLIADFNAEKQAALNVKVLQAKTYKELRDAKIAALNEEERQILDKTNLTESQRLLIQEEFAQKRTEVENEATRRILETIDEIANYANQAFSILSQFNQARSNMENEALKRDMANNDKRKRDLEMKSKKGIITENEYRSQVIKMDQEMDNKKRKLEADQFERNRKQQIAQALINGAVGITRAWVSPGFPLAILMTALIAASTAAQVATINSQKPQFAKGGIASGPAHGSKYGESGIALVRRDNGQEVGEMEGGEPYMILSRKFRQNNPGIIPMLLAASRTGQSVMPFFMGRTYQGINYSAISSGRQRSFAEGGIVNQSNGSQQPIVVSAQTEKMEMLFEALIKRLEMPSIAVISQKKIEDANTVKQTILREATFQ